MHVLGREEDREDGGHPSADFQDQGYARNVPNASVSGVEGGSVDIVERLDAGGVREMCTLLQVQKATGNK